MTSGGGGSALVRVSHAAAVAVPSGDLYAYGDGPEWVVLPADPQGLAQVVRRWLEGVGDSVCYVSGAAALALQPLDPDGVLSEDARAEWDSHLAWLRDPYGETLSATFHLDEATTAALRDRLLASDASFRGVSGALKDPVAGDWLRAGLADGDLNILDCSATGGRR